MKILIVSPYCSRNGAEMMITHLANFGIINENDFEVRGFFPQRGNLRSILKFQYLISFEHKNFWSRLLNRLCTSVLKYSISEIELLRYSNKFRPDFWYLNSVHLAKYAKLAYKHKIPFVVHFHDLFFQYEKITLEDLRFMIEKSNALIGCSAQVCKTIKSMGAKNVYLQYECIDDNIKSTGDQTVKIKEELLEGGVNLDDFSSVWIMSGTANVRKGVDRILKIAEKLPETCFLWLGRSKSGIQFFCDEYVNQHNVKNVFFLEHQIKYYYEILSSADGFLLTSREDPFPLVMLEAATLGKPIVGYKSGGIEEFVNSSKMGGVVDTDDEIVKLIRSIDSSKHLIDPKRIKERGMEFATSKQYPNWISILNTIAKS